MVSIIITMYNCTIIINIYAGSVKNNVLIAVSASSIIFFTFLFFTFGVCCGYLLKKFKTPKDELFVRECQTIPPCNDDIPISKSSDSCKQQRELEMEENVAYGLFNHVRND